jgi:oligoendopeptidase F
VETVEPAEQARGVVWDLAELLARGPVPERLDALHERALEFAERWRGRMAALTAGEIQQALTESAELIDEMRRLTIYGELREAADVLDEEARDLKALLERATVDFANTMRFFELDWLALDDERAEELASAPELAASAYHLRQRRRLKPYRLSEPEENALAVRAQSAEGAWIQLHGERLATTVVEFDSGLGLRPHTLAELRSLGRHPDRALRQAALDAHYQALEPLAPLLAHCYDALVSDRLSVDRLRGFGNPMLPTHLDNELEPEIVEEMLAAITAGYGLAQRWYRLKARLLGLNRLEYYDVNAPVDVPLSLSYRQAAALLEESLSDFDGELAQRAVGLLERRHVDAEVRPDKSPGAFCAPLPADVGPYLLLNYNDKIEDALTLAHEMGHALHSELASAGQPAYQDEPGSAVAEIASTFAETLMFERLLQDAKPEERLGLLAGQLERTFGAIFIQVVMTRFELAAYNLRGSGQALLAPRLDQLWLDELGHYLAGAVELPPFYGLGWAYIPHFVFARFYTYSYAFALLAALALVERRGEQGFAERYRSFLAAGASDSPATLLERLGVTLDRELWQTGLRRLERWIDEAETLEASLEPADERL